MKSGKTGFTIIEVSIFLAISGLLFFAVTLGVQNSINQQRRNDSVQSFMEFLRGVYSSVTNVQNEISGGKSDEAIYGKAVFFNEGSNDKVTVKTVVAKAEYDEASGDVLDSLKKLDWKLYGEGRFTDSYTLKWGARVEDSTSKGGTLLIVRSPITGSVNTYWRDGVNTSLNTGNFVKKQLDICINTGINPRSDVRIAADARNASGIALYTDKDNKCQ